MDWIGSYVYRIAAAAVVCGLVRLLAGKKGASSGTVQMLTAIFMLLTILSPFATLSLTSLPQLTDGIMADADDLVASGSDYRYEEMSSIIKERTEAYIFDKAAELGAELTVRVEVSRADIPVPIAAELEGAISPYGKTKLTKILTDDLGIPVEAQTWISNQS